MKLKTDWIKYRADRTEPIEQGFCGIIGRLFILLVVKGSRMNWFTTRLKLLSIDEIVKAHHRAFEELGGSPSFVEYEETVTRIVARDVNGRLNVHPALLRIASSYAFLMQFSIPMYSQPKGNVERHFRQMCSCFEESLSEHASPEENQSKKQLMSAIHEDICITMPAAEKD